jgi:hypothetical protein
MHGAKDESRSKDLDEIFAEGGSDTARQQIVSEDE